MKLSHDGAPLPWRVNLQVRRRPKAAPSKKYRPTADRKFCAFSRVAHCGRMAPGERYAARHRFRYDAHRRRLLRPRQLPGRQLRRRGGRRGGLLSLGRRREKRGAPLRLRGRAVRRPTPSGPSFARSSACSATASPDATVRDRLHAHPHGGPPRPVSSARSRPPSAPDRTSRRRRFSSRTSRSRPSSPRRPTRTAPSASSASTPSAAPASTSSGLLNEPSAAGFEYTHRYRNTLTSEARPRRRLRHRRRHLRRLAPAHERAAVTR